MPDSPFDPDSIPVYYLREDKAKTSGYVMEDDIPEPYRSMISSNLVPCAVLDLPDKGICYYQHDWERWVRSLDRREGVK